MRAGSNGTDRTAIKQASNRLTPLVVLTLFCVTFFIYEDFRIRMLFGYGCMMFFALYFYFHSGFRIKSDRLKLASVILAFAITVILLLHPSARLERNTVYLILSLDISMIFVVLAEPRKKDLSAAFRIIAFSAVMISLYVIACYFFPAVFNNGTARFLSDSSRKMAERLLRDGYGVAVGGNVVFSDYLGFLGLIICVSRLMQGVKNRRKKAEYLIVAFICFFAIVVMNRKSELLGTLIVLAILFSGNLGYSSVKQKRKVRTRLIVLILGLAMLAVFFISRGYLARYVRFFSRIQTNSAGSTDLDISSGRLSLWKSAWELFLTAPVFGIGWGMFSKHITVYNQYYDSQLSNVHNNYLQLLCETGIVGLLMVLIPMTVIFVLSIRKLRLLKQKGVRDFRNTAVTTSVSFQLFSFILSFIDPIWYKMFFWCFYAVAVIFANVPVEKYESY